MPFSVRPTQEADAVALIAHRRLLMAETAFLLYEAGELDKTAEDERARIARLQARGNSTVLVAEDGTALVGNLTAVGGEVRRLKHSATLALGVVRSHWGQGIGAALLRAAIDWSTSAKLHRLELTVHTTNLRALGLYLNHGFQVEGVRRHSLKIEGEYVNEYLMSRLSDA